MTTIFERRRIEAELIKEIFAVLQAEVGEQRARDLLSRAISPMARKVGEELAAQDRTQNVQSSLPAFYRHLERWKADGALEIREIECTEQRLSFDVTRCRYAEMYQELGVRHIGDVLSCRRDGELICGYMPGVRFERTQTIMSGATHCDFRFTRAEDPAAARPSNTKESSK